MISLIGALIRPAAVMVAILAGSAAAQAQDAPRPTCRSVIIQQGYEDRLGPIDYDAPKADCTINWVQNGRMLSLDWTFLDAFDGMALRDQPDGTQLLAASREPTLIDIDQDGWLDVTVFSLFGMVNGDYDVFRYDPESDRFVHFGTMNGAGFTRHPSGYLVAVGRSSAAASGVEVFSVGPDGLVSEVGMYVDAGLQTGPGGAPECRVTVAGTEYTNPSLAKIAAIFPDDPDLIASYCNLYEGETRPGTRLMDIPANPVVVPDGTVFYCQLQGTTKAVTVTRDDAGFHYAFGPVDGPPELALTRPADQVRVMPDNGAGPSRFGEITFQNGAYEYTVSYGFELFDDTGALRDITETFQRNLVVIRDGNAANPVFERTCDPELAADRIAFLDPS